MGYPLLILLTGLCFLFTPTVSARDVGYVGAKVCAGCHEEQYERFMAYSKKADSFSHIKKMEKKLTAREYKDCFHCHTTGYGEKGGFVSEDQTPDMKNPGCEVCHGPGSRHAESQDPDDIVRQMSLEDCRVCHNSQRVEAFGFKPLLYGGAH